DRNNLRAHSNLGIALTSIGRPDEAIAAFQTALQLNPNDSMALFNLGSAFKDQGRLDEAIASYRRALELDPASDTAHSNIIYAMHFHSGYDAEAIRKELRKWNERFARPVMAKVVKGEPPPQPSPGVPGE